MISNDNCFGKTFLLLLNAIVGFQIYNFHQMEHHFDQNQFSAIDTNNYAASYMTCVSNQDTQLECKASTSSVAPKMVFPKRAANGNCQFCKDKQISAANWCRHLRRKHPEELGLSSTNKPALDMTNNTNESCSNANKPKRKSEIWKCLQYFPNDKCIECHKEMRNLSPWNAKRHLIKKHPELLERFGLVDKETNNSHPSTYEQLLALTEESYSSQSRLEDNLHFFNDVQNGVPETGLLTAGWETAKLDRYKAETRKIKLECEKLQLETSLAEKQLRLKTIEVRLAERSLEDETSHKVIIEADTRSRVAEARLKELQVRELEIKLGLFR